MDCEEFQLLAQEASRDKQVNKENLSAYSKIIQEQVPQLKIDQLNDFFRQAIFIIKSKTQEDIENILSEIKKTPNKEIRNCLKKMTTDKQNEFLNKE